MYSEKEIKKLCGSERTFQKAKQLYTEGGILDITVDYVEDLDIMAVDGLVEGSYDNSYNVWMEYSPEDNQIVSYECGCAAYEAYPGMCKHCGALALEYLEMVESRNKIKKYKGMKQLDMYPLLKTDSTIKDIVKNYATRKRLNEQKPQGSVEIIPLLGDTGAGFYYSRSRYTLTFRIGTNDGRMYVLKNLEEFIRAVQNEEKYSYGKQLAFVHSKSVFTEAAWKYVMLIAQGVGNRNGYYGNSCKELHLNSTLLEEFLMLNINGEVEYDCKGRQHKKLYIYDENPPIKVILREVPGGFVAKIPPLDLVEGVSELFVKKENKVFRCSEEFAYAMDGFLRAADKNVEKAYKIAAGDMQAFCGSVLPELENQKLLDSKGISLEDYRPKKAEILYYLDETNGRITAKAISEYGEARFNLLAPKKLSHEYHDLEKEERALELAKSYFQNEDEREQLLYFEEADDEKMYQLLEIGIKQLAEEGEVYVSDSLKGKRVVRSPKTQVGVALKGGLLELRVNTDSFTKEDLAGVLDSYRKKKKYYRMKNGDFLNLEEGALTTVAELLDGLALTDKALNQEIITVPKFRACFVDQVLRQKDGQLQVDRGAEYKAVIRSMKNVEDSDYKVPDSLLGILREYQKIGYRWLSTLAELGFGGILADDMGLGKTLQTITYILGRKQSKEGIHLIICPASLVYNWKKEFEMFAPALEVRMMVGTAMQREELLQIGGGDVWVTSYDMIKRDIDLYKGITFDTEVIDEAQNIKNQGTLAAKSVKKIKAEVRIALTGTPIENRLSELWSIFDYLMPGLLGTYDKFRKGYEVPIVQSKDEELLQRLKKMVSPFILRRMKRDVLKELPDKIEQIVYSQMEEEQRKLYVGHVERLLESLGKKSSQEVQSGKLEILAELTRLRQLCCDPALLYDNYVETSCKIDTCTELVNEAVEGNHKVLIFSQFTSIFPMLGKRLKKEKISYYELTGSTPKEKRMEMVDAFNKDDVPVFLISLKAGGTGLNLTAASIVIHFDPWWNLAAQNQATDRAHRIGQEEQVVVFKLIAKDTIEEKILGLQEQKQKLASQILDGEGISASSLTKDDFMEILKF